MKKKPLIILLALLTMLGLPALAQQKTENLQTVRDYLKECKVYYLATADGDQPRVRPFGVAEVYQGRLYIMTGKAKNVFKQTQANPKFEITAVKPSGAEWIRISGKLVNDDDVKVKEYLLSQNPSLKNSYSATDGNMAALCIVDGEATLNSFTGPARTIRF